MTVFAVSETAERILDVAQGLAQTRGFHGFSYADIAAELGITKASLHYHFATKAELGRSMLIRYSERFGAALAELDIEPDPRKRLYRYVEIYESVVVRDRMCLCGMFAAEYQALPAPMQRELRCFFDANEVWLAETLASGREAAVLIFPGSPVEAARALTATLEGAMLLARAYEEPARFTTTAQSVLDGLIA
jgi:TetR/AcrR family transcriptional regulator, transcriptional repressor for nem operon